ncbi:MAG: hypothetical protein ABL967_07055 [Bryobacteraceae bacterium]
MSKTCGDTARFNRIRKQKIAKRASIRKLRAEIEARKAAANPPGGTSAS